ncbi:Nramp family divalent metal transporter [Adhaeribacter radiodurans]|uniref:Nramp family divalent metal transporter n=1 Tax=Adhaeribacter radiodurans TaxID=2745197 RepID=A0A7L7L7I7_9BACT|nr:Nramp family divalent metal transporter [Adhaeribacter radiodurans]QMU28329.1 Nramp family divalent metal transporter [Adhaeribacter radiodurans]
MDIKVTDQPENSTASRTHTPKIINYLKKGLLSLGPGIITAALVFGPSKMTITSKLGAVYGYSLLWIVVVAIFFMTLFTTMSARIGVATQQSLLSTIRLKWGKAAAIAIGIGVFFVTTSFQAGNSVGVGISIAEASGTSPVIWIVFFNILGIALLFFRSFYKVLEKLMIFLIALMLFAFITTLFMVKPSLSGVASGFVPSIPAGSLGLVIAFTASCFSIVGAFYQSYLVQERIKLNPEIKEKDSNSIPGIFILGLMSAIVLICAAAVLHPKGIPVTSASDMAKALEPLFGKYSSILFLTGLFGAAFSSLVGNASVGGTLLGDALGYGSQLNNQMVRLLIALVMIIGAIIAIVFGKLPLELIVFAQSVTIFLVPFIGIALYFVANDAHLMGKLKNTVTMKIFGSLGLLILILLAASNINELFLK